MAMPPAVEISKKRKDPLFKRRVENSPGFRTKNGSEDIVTLWFIICLLSWMKQKQQKYPAWNQQTPLKIRRAPEGNFIFQPLFFRGELLVFALIYLDFSLLPRKSIKHRPTCIKIEISLKQKRYQKQITYQLIIFYWFEILKLFQTLITQESNTRSSQLWGRFPQALNENVLESEQLT